MRAAAAAAVLALGFLLPGAASSPAAVWEMAASSEHNLAAADPSLAVADLDQPGVLLQGSAPLTADPVPAGWLALPEERWTSEAQFITDLGNGSIPSYVRVAHYDNEAWSQTPLKEQKNPPLYEQLFCQSAHASGLACATGPAMDICPVAYPGNGTNAHCYTAKDLAGTAAKYADYTDIQAQTLEGATSAYLNQVKTAAVQAHNANPANVTLGNLSPTAVPGVSAAQLNSDARAVCPAYVTGFYMTITSAGAAVADQFLALFEPSGPGSTAC